MFARAVSKNLGMATSPCLGTVYSIKQGNTDTPFLSIYKIQKALNTADLPLLKLKKTNQKKPTVLTNTLESFLP